MTEAQAPAEHGLLITKDWLRALAPFTAEIGEAERTVTLERAKAAAWAAWAAAVTAFQTAAYEAAKGGATYEEARAKADAVFDKHRDVVREQLQALYLDMINAELHVITAPAVAAAAA